MFCIFEEGGVWLPDKNELHLEKLALHVEEYDDEIQEIVFHMGRRCLRPEGNDNCEKAFWYHKCWKTYDPKVRYAMNYKSLWKWFLICNPFPFFSFPQHYFLV